MNKEQSQVLAQALEAPLLKGEGEVQYIKRTRVRQDCAICGEPADFRHSYLLHDARRNMASSAYGKDDCSWCSDAEEFTCAEHERKGASDLAPDGHSWCGTFPLAKFPHMGLRWREEKLPAAAIASIESPQLQEQPHLAANGGLSVNQAHVLDLLHANPSRDLYEGAGDVPHEGSGMYWLSYSATERYSPLSSTEVLDMAKRGLIEEKWPGCYRLAAAPKGQTP